MKALLSIRNWTRIAAFALVSMGVIAACGRSEQTDTPQQQAAATPANQINITGNDQMLFSVTSFDAPVGEDITLVLQNVGSLPKQAMGHNVVILQLGTSVPDFATAAAAAVETDYIPQGMEGAIIAHTRLLGPGESDTITFTAPSTPGAYTYICSFPGHYALMKGIMNVR